MEFETTRTADSYITKVTWNMETFQADLRKLGTTSADTRAAILKMRDVMEHEMFYGKPTSPESRYSDDASFGSF